MTQVVVGFDEVGRGCIAGPVVAAAVILDHRKPIEGLMDSKKLTKKRRMELSSKIFAKALDWSIGCSDVQEIDNINILQASLLGMKRAFDGLTVKADFAQVDGIFYPDIDIDGECIKGGDNIIAEISAASIIAKVYRDEHMAILDVLYPGYDLAKHAGYPTPDHKKRLASLGVVPIYRQSFSPVRQLLA